MAGKQAPSAIMMVRPRHFGYNEETAVSNHFQQVDGKENTEEIRKKALTEFDHCLSIMRESGLRVVVFDPKDQLNTLDEVFPNNWVSFHSDGKVIIYSMMSPIRRQEKRMDFITSLQKDHGFLINEILDFSYYERKGVFLEGTGSLVFDYEHKIAYMNTSDRSHTVLADKVIDLLGYRKVQFKAVDRNGLDIYHTNVLMCVGSDFAVVCLDALPINQERTMLERSLLDTQHQIVNLSFAQMEAFAGNMMELLNEKGEKVTVMSECAYQSLSSNQLKIIQKSSKVVSVPIYTIEKYGGGSVRCMMAGIFLPTDSYS